MQLLLWDIMAEVGVPAQFLTAVQSMYVNDDCCDRMNGFVAEPFTANKGVRQGCTSSPGPAMFGIFTDRFYFMLMHRTQSTQSEAGPVLRESTRVPSLFHAYDGTLLANDPCSMHKLCAGSGVFCGRSGMMVPTGLQNF